MKKAVRLILITLMILVLLFLTRCEKESNLPTDGDGNVYDTVIIGTQVWLTENLKTTKYRNGAEIRLVTDNTEWSELELPAYCWYNNDPAIYKDTYGALYNWYAAKLDFLCPTGFHIPTIEEWTTMINYLGGESLAGGKLKENGITHWESPNTGATNETGFLALPGGDRSRYGPFDNIGYNGIWWTASTSDDLYAWRLSIHNVSPSLYKTSFPKEAGFSVRCVKDN